MIEWPRRVRQCLIVLALTNCHTSTVDRQLPTLLDAGPGRQPTMSDTVSEPGVTVDLGACPDDRESSVGKLAHEKYLSEHPDDTHRAVIVLRPLAQQVAVCEGDSTPDARCQARDHSLTERLEVNAKQWRCVSEDFAGSNPLPVLQGRWYEKPYHMLSGRPIPIGTMVELPMSWQQIQRAAQHPYVERIEPALGAAEIWGPPLAAAETECPPAQDAALPKLGELQSIRDRGRQPAVVDLRSEGFLPALTPCSEPESEACSHVLWERTILSTRDVTCVRRSVDRIVAAQSQVSYGASSGSLVGPALPPFGDPTASVQSFGQGLTWDEALRLAEHPSVKRIWTSDGLMFDMPAISCSADTPIAETQCTPERESSNGKISSVFEDTTDLQHVRLKVRGGATICTLSECPSGSQPCPERSRLIAHWEAQNLESQRCVRQLIVQLGGQPDATSDWLVNIFQAELTWSQIQEVARHPHVEYLSGDNNEGDDGGGFL